MTNQEKNTSIEQSKGIAAKEKVGSSMTRLLNSTEAKLVGGAGPVKGSTPIGS